MVMLIALGFLVQAEQWDSFVLCFQKGCHFGSLVWEVCFVLGPSCYVLGFLSVDHIDSKGLS